MLGVSNYSFTKSLPKPKFSCNCFMVTETDLEKQYFAIFKQRTIQKKIDNMKKNL